ncbi:Gfo/Idh/MocA family oxidoreductase [Candidatus Sumerlaeota bacterium]|nr:Gfo/Idh/MocA family oxidoreductase [Candidatus Sumerlaeota bacterium]
MDRRDFIKKAGASAGVAVLAAGCATTKSAPKVESAPAIISARKLGDKINVGMIGQGGRGSHLLGQFLAQKNLCQVVAVCDVYQRRVTRAKETCAKRGVDVKTTTNYMDILDMPEVDVVVVATPDHWHAPISIAAMHRGKDVYCEKPMTHTIPEAREMAETSIKLKRIVQVGSQTTSSDQWWKAKKALADGMIGKLLMSQGSYHRNSAGGEWNYGIDHTAGPDKTGEDYLDWELWQKPAKNHYEFYAPRFFRFRKYWDYSGGIATDLFFHVMAPLNLVWPEPEFPWRAVGTGGIYVQDDGREVPDTFMLAADYPSGHSVVLSSSMANSTHIPGLIRGHEGTIVMVPGGQFEGLTPFITVTPEDIGDVKKNFIAKYGAAEVQLKTEFKGDPIVSHIRNFLECVRSREETTLSARKAYRVQVAINLGIESYQQGKVLYFDTDQQVVTDKRPANTIKLAKPGVINGENVAEPDYGKVDLKIRKA